jgi:Calcineurin-like phosphoesterase
MKIQYISDIHLETIDNEDFKKFLIPNAPYLVLCGDIGYPHSEIFKNFIRYCSKLWEQVFYITGNHDYYNNIHTKWKHKKPYSMKEIDEYIEELFKSYQNVHYLQKGQFDIPNTNYSILGCTLWVYIPSYKNINCLTYLNDVNYISFDGIRRLSPDDITNLHEEHCNWLFKKLEYLESLGRKAIVLTHHLPTQLLINEHYLNDPRNYLFYTELSGHLESKALKAWICGHSHANRKVIYKNDVELMMNCKGYPNEKIKNFNPSCIYEIKEKINNISSEENITSDAPCWNRTSDLLFTRQTQYHYAKEA